MTISFHIPGEPRGKGRPRFVRATGRTYTDDETAAYENLVKLSARQAMRGAPPLPGAVEVIIGIAISPPASASKRKRAAMLEQKLQPVKKPDVDIVCKSVLDGCNGIVFEDDKQVCKLSVAKAYATPPGVSVWVVVL